jgi:hypothetical protein
VNRKKGQTIFTADLSHYQTAAISPWQPEPKMTMSFTKVPPIKKLAHKA